MTLDEYIENHHPGFKLLLTETIRRELEEEMITLQRTFQGTQSTPTMAHWDILFDSPQLLSVRGQSHR